MLQSSRRREHLMRSLLIASIVGVAVILLMNYIISATVAIILYCFLLAVFAVILLIRNGRPDPD